MRNVFVFTVPYDLDPGANYKIAVGNLTETVYDLSDGFFTIQCQPSDLPDLHVEEISLNPPHPAMGDSVEVRAKVVNKGPGYSPPFSASIKVDMPQGHPPRTYDFRVHPLGHPDFGRNYSEIFRRIQHGAWGIYKATITLDLNGEVEESDKNNNQKVKRYTVDPLPDLIVCIRDGGGTYVQTNKKIWASVKNIGPRQSPPCKLSWSIEEHGTDSIDVPRLDSMEEVIFYKSPKWSFPGTQSIWAAVDKGNEVKEIHEDNNEVMGSISVTIPPNSPPARSRRKCSNRN
jgi:hypothetical protein